MVVHRSELASRCDRLESIENQTYFCHHDSLGRFHSRVYNGNVGENPTSGTNSVQLALSLYTKQKYYSRRNEAGVYISSNGST